MKWSDVLGSAGGIAGIAGIVYGFLTWWSNREKDKSEARTEAEALQVAISNSDTAAVAAILTGYKEQVAGLQADVASCHRRLDDQAEENRLLRERNEQMTAHIARLELMIPVPPGAPMRPWLL